MNYIISVILIVISVGSDWTNDLGKAKKSALEENRLILLNFSGSDWCGPCIMLKKKAFAKDEFKSLAEKQLVLMRADFPRLKRNRLSAAEAQKNEALAELYNPSGKFPFTLLLSAEGKVLKSWDGFNGNANDFISSLQNAVNE